MRTSLFIASVYKISTCETSLFVVNINPCAVESIHSEYPKSNLENTNSIIQAILFIFPMND